MPVMSLKEYDELVDYIDKNHGINNPQRKKVITYITCFYHVKTKKVFGVTLQGEFEKSVEFKIVGENRRRDLKKWIYCWLENKHDGFSVERDDPDMKIINDIVQM